MKWVTREHPKTDRIACPWLIRTFIDPEAEFLYVPAAEVLKVLAGRYELEAVGGGAIDGPAPAERYRYADGGGHVGVIASVTRPFCGTCDRIRLTAEGQLRNCLFSVRETDLRGILRSGGSDDDLAAAIEAEVGRKWAGHSIGQVHFIRPARSMSQIGG